MNPEILRNYQALANQYQSLSDSKKKQIKFISFARFFCFIGILPAFYYLNPINSVFAFVVSFLLLAAFLILIKKFIQAEKDLLYYQQLTEINENEVKASNHAQFNPEGRKPVCHCG